MSDDQTAPARYGAAMRARRQRLGMSQEKLAEVARTSRTHLSAVETGRIGMPEAPLRGRIAAALNTTDGALLAEAGLPPQPRDTALPPELAEVVERLPDDPRGRLRELVEQLDDRQTLYVTLNVEFVLGLR